MVSSRCVSLQAVRFLPPSRPSGRLGPLENPVAPRAGVDLPPGPYAATWANVGACRGRPRFRAGRGNSPSPLTPRTNQGPTHPGSRACRFVPDLPLVHLARVTLVGREGEGGQTGPKTPDSRRRTPPTQPPRGNTAPQRPARGERPRKTGQRAKGQRRQAEAQGPAKGPARGARRTAPKAEHGQGPKEPTHPPGTPAERREGPAVRGGTAPEAGRKAHRRPRPPTWLRRGRVVGRSGGGYPTKRLKATYKSAPSIVSRIPRRSRLTPHACR